jgi:transcription antitermination factor NusG
MTKWHVWTVLQSHYKKIESFLSELPEVESFLYPKVVREYDTKSGRKFRSIPLYSTYIFIRYNHTPQVVSKITGCQWIKNYVGVCSEEEMTSVEALSQKKYEDLTPTKEVKLGHYYRLKGTPFIGMTCFISDIVGDKLTVSVELFGSERFIKCSTDDIELEGR